jgi:hypothetical protein
VVRKELPERRPVKVGRGGWFGCNVCSHRHTETSKVGRAHWLASQAVMGGPEDYDPTYLTPSLRRLVAEVFAYRAAIRKDTVPDVFRRAFEDV